MQNVVVQILNSNKEIIYTSNKIESDNRLYIFLPPRKEFIVE
jgi:hypothetical protein